ncbi:hypothetical protein QWJ26_07160 [Streptomyces sp. CSDS2]|uniref:hypothetical protein n=1 Tax=Streptomyces sp. CSDS2 TaxID=3055051 RepID=UPI0025B1A4A7|nr:hypothetical protein [Streptomyces sp. CSDS2]MDN3259596.1 hypothetical protein [Streptomyces sp. CSDS2]
MAIQANAMPPSLVAEINEMKRRITSLERKPKLGSVNERLPVGMIQSPSLEGTEGDVTHGLGVINTTGLNMPVILATLPFHIPWGTSGPLDVSVTIWLQDGVTGGKTKEITLDKSLDQGGWTRNLNYSWIHPQPVGFDDDRVYKHVSIAYRVNKRVTFNGESLTVGVGLPSIVVGIPLGTYVEESADGNPRIDGLLTPVPE